MKTVMHRIYDADTNTNHYFDRNGKEVKAGMFLRQINTNEVHQVYECSDDIGSRNLGFPASNPAFLKRHPDWPEEYYPLYMFELSYWEIVEAE